MYQGVTLGTLGPNEIVNCENRVTLLKNHIFKIARDRKIKRFENQYTKLGTVL